MTYVYPIILVKLRHYDHLIRTECCFVTQ